MIDKRSEAEIKMYALVIKLQGFFERKVGREEFQAMLGEMRDIKVLLVNKQLGCWSGRHASECNCVPDQPSQTIFSLKRRNI